MPSRVTDVVDMALVNLLSIENMDNVKIRVSGCKTAIFTVLPKSPIIVKFVKRHTRSYRDASGGVNQAA